MKKAILPLIFIFVVCFLYQTNSHKDSNFDNEFTNYITLSVRCDTILDNLELLQEEKRDMIPDDGIIFTSSSVGFYDNESVFDVLVRQMKDNKIHMEYANTPIYDSAYIEGIYNIYEFDCGPTSGWSYSVNNWFPNYGISKYELKDGDIVEILYTCDLGHDIGGNNFEN